jgi:hypothetical protein
MSGRDGEDQTGNAAGGDVLQLFCDQAVMGSGLVFGHGVTDKVHQVITGPLAAQ